MGRVICTISGGMASAYMAVLALRIYPRADIVFYFNDTGWEDEDLYRFLRDVEQHCQISILHDNDGRNVEELSYDTHTLPNNYMPFCSHHLKAARLQKYIQSGDTVLFGIDRTETHRARRLIERYGNIAKEKNLENFSIRFPLIEHNVSKEEIQKYFESNNIPIPRLYSLGFKHNNCGGGCVRQSKKQWINLLRALPNVYAERERLEQEISEYFGRRMTYMKDTSLKELREQAELQISMIFDADDDRTVTECMGICSTQQ